MVLPSAPWHRACVSVTCPPILEAALARREGPPVFCPVVYRGGDDATGDAEEARHRRDHGARALVVRVAIVPARRHERTQ